MGSEIIPVSVHSVDRSGEGRVPALPDLVLEAGANARFAWEEFFDGELENANTRRNYSYAVRGILDHAHQFGISLTQITPKFVRGYLQNLKDQDGNRVAASTEKVYLAGIRRFFDICVTRHAIALNPAASVRGRRHRKLEGSTPEIAVKQAKQLLASIDTSTLIGKRDLAILATLIYTGARVGAVSSLRLEDFVNLGDQYVLRFAEKGGKERRIPVRHDLQQMILDYLDAAGLGVGGVNAATAKPHTPLFRAATQERHALSSLTGNGVSRIVISKMLKRRLKGAELPLLFSPHSCRVTVATDLLNQGVPLEDVQNLLGHADPRTTRIYDRRQHQVTRNIVERISV
jgi:site-specific recombinase XerD